MSVATETSLYCDDLRHFTLNDVTPYSAEQPWPVHRLVHPTVCCGGVAQRWTCVVSFWCTIWELPGRIGTFVGHGDDPRVICTTLMCFFFGAFAKFAKGDYQLRHVRPHGTTRLPLDGFS